MPSMPQGKPVLEDDYICDKDFKIQSGIKAIIVS